MLNKANKNGKQHKICSPAGAVAGVEVLLVAVDLVEVEIVGVVVNSEESNPNGSLQRWPSQHVALQLSIEILKPGGTRSLNWLSQGNELQLLDGSHLHKDAVPEIKYIGLVKLVIIQIWLQLN